MVEYTSPGRLDLEGLDRGSPRHTTAFGWVARDRLTDRPTVSVRSQRQGDVGWLAGDDVLGLRAVTCGINVGQVRLPVGVGRDRAGLAEADPGIFGQISPRSNAGTDEYNVDRDAVVRSFSST